jgi:RNA polymerase sigma factor (sigma-70 family)
MPDRQTAEKLFLEHLPRIIRLAHLICARHPAWAGEADEFASWVQMKVMEDDYATIRNFRGEANLKTYLANVVGRQFHEYRRHRLGRWRHSALAERLGPPAPKLEELVYRDGYTLEQAGEQLRTSGATDRSDRQLAQLLDQLPRRGPMRPREVGSDSPALQEVRSTSRADETVTAAEAEGEHGRLIAALDRAMRRLDVEDQVIVRMRFIEKRTLAFVARALGLEQKPLYRRQDRVLKQLRILLEQEGVRRADVQAILVEQEEP